MKNGQKGFQSVAIQVMKERSTGAGMEGLIKEKSAAMGGKVVVVVVGGILECLGSEKRDAP